MNARLEAALKRFSDSFRASFTALDVYAEALRETKEAENALAAVSNYDVVFVLRPVAKELSEFTVHRYVDILYQARGMLLDGEEIPDVLCHFDMMLYNLKQGRK